MYQNIGQGRCTPQIGMVGGKIQMVHHPVVLQRLANRLNLTTPELVPGQRKTSTRIVILVVKMVIILNDHSPDSFSCSSVATFCPFCCALQSWWWWWW